MAANDGRCFYGLCPSMRPDVVLSTDRDHELTISNPISWPRCAFLCLRWVLHHDCHSAAFFCSPLHAAVLADGTLGRASGITA